MSSITKQGKYWGLHRQSQIGTGGRARILFHSMAEFLELRGLTDDLKTVATYIEEQSWPAPTIANPIALVDPTAGVPA